MAAIRYGWQKFQQNVSSILVAVIIYIVGLIVVEVLWFILIRGVLSTGSFIGMLAVDALGSVVFGLIGYIIQAGIARGALAITDGRTFTRNDLFTTEQLPNVILTGLIVGVLTGIGTFLCFVPGLIVAFLAQFSIYFVVDKNLAPVEAITASFRLVTGNLGPVVIFFLLSILVFIVGFCAICIGLIVAAPVVVIAQAYMFRTLQNEPVAA